MNYSGIDVPFCTHVQQHRQATLDKVECAGKKMELVSVKETYGFEKIQAWLLTPFTYRSSLAATAARAPVLSKSASAFIDVRRSIILL